MKLPLQEKWNAMLSHPHLRLPYIAEDDGEPIYLPEINAALARAERMEEALRDLIAMCASQQKVRNPRKERKWCQAVAAARAALAEPDK